MMLVMIMWTKILKFNNQYLSVVENSNSLKFVVFGDYLGTGSFFIKKAISLGHSVCQCLDADKFNWFNNITIYENPVFIDADLPEKSKKTLHEFSPSKKLNPFDKIKRVFILIH